MPAAASFEEYAVGFCSAFDALFRAVGNPDTAEDTVLSKALDAAVAAHDGKSAERLGSEITTELESGRRHVAFARGWPPAGPMMGHLDRVFVAFEAMTTAKVAAANLAPGSAEPTGGTPWQTAFEQAGGVDAWFAMLEAWPSIGAERPAGAKACANVPIGP